MDDVANRGVKEKLAAEIARQLKDGQVVGAGSGSTSLLTIRAIGERMKREGIRCTAIPTSVEAELACVENGIPVTTLLSARPDWSFD